jgi:hypothetical protein
MRAPRLARLGLALAGRATLASERGIVHVPALGGPTAGSATLRSAHYRSHVPAEAAILGDIRAQKQEDRVLDWFRTHAGRHTPWAVAEALEIHIVSARRAITNLTARNLLRHHPAERRDAGPLRAKSSTWGVV